MERYGNLIRDFSPPQSWYEPDCFEEKECRSCVEKEMVFDKVAVKFIDVLKDLCGEECLDKEALFDQLEEIAGLLEIEFKYKKLSVDRKVDN